MGPYRIDIDPFAIVESRELSRSSIMMLFSGNGISSLHEGNFARFKIRPSEFFEWQKRWK